MIDNIGNHLQTEVTDPRYIDGDLTPFSKDKIIVKDKDGNTFQTDITDPKYINGGYVGATKGLSLHKHIKSGKLKLLSKDDPNVINESYIPYSNTRGKIHVIDKDGNHLHVNGTDPKYLSGELKPFSKGRCSLKNIYTKETISISKIDPRYKMKEWVGVNTKYIYIINEKGNRERVLIEDERVQKKLTNLD